MPGAFDIPISWTELAKRTIKDAGADNVLGLAAQLAFYFLLALVPAIACVVALTSFLPPETIERMLQSVATVAPGRHAGDPAGSAEQPSPGAKTAGSSSLGLLMALWSSSAALVAVTDALNRAYDIEEGRPWWKVRLLAIALTIGLALFVVSASPWLSRPGAGRDAGLARRPWRRVHWDLEDPAVADRVRPGRAGDRAHLLLRARCRPGLGLDHAWLGAGHPAVAARRRWPSAST